MQAVTEFLEQYKIAKVEGWVVSGASKRGWTSWLVGATDCPTCVKILGIVPIVPIVPTILKDIHRQWQSYNGFTFVFADYTKYNLTQKVGSAKWALADKVLDPINHIDALEKIPKFIIVSSDDEFMSFDWTNIYYDQFTGEKHLLIVPNSEHTMATGIYQTLAAVGTFVRSIATGKDFRPNFEYKFSSGDGSLTVKIP